MHLVSEHVALRQPRFPSLSQANERTPSSSSQTKPRKNEKQNKNQKRKEKNQGPGGRRSGVRGGPGMGLNFALLKVFYRLFSPISEVFRGIAVVSARFHHCKCLHDTPIWISLDIL